MAFELWPAVLAGIIGAVVMVAARLLMKAAGMDLKMDVMRIWGTMFKVHGTPGRILGLVVHLMVSALIALIYAWGFNLLGVEENLWLWGLLGGLIHWLMAGLFLIMVPPMHPEIPERRPAPGAFVKNFGSPDVPAFLIGHLLYGLTVGILYAYFTGNGGAAF